MALLKALFFIASTLATPAQADFTEGQISTTTGTGSGKSTSAGIGGKISFDLSELHADFSRQFSPVDPADPTSPMEITTTSGVGFVEAAGEKLNLGVDYDQLTDRGVSLTISGGKLTLGFGSATISFREAKSTIDQNLTLGSRAIQGAFIYQTTYEGSYSFEFGRSDYLLPTFAYSTFSPDIEHFAEVLNRPAFSRTASTSNFTGNLQAILENYERWVVKVVYGHDFGDRWSSSILLRAAQIPILEKTLLLNLEPALERHWTPEWSTQIAYNLTYLDGQKTWGLSLDLKLHLRN